MALETWEYIMYLVLGTMCVALNSTEIILIIKKRKSMTTFDLILMNLALADLIVGLSMLVLAIYSKGNGTDFTLRSGDRWSYAIFATKVFAVFSSITNILAISLDRVLAVKVPIKHKVWMSCENAKWIICVVWLTSLVFTFIAAGLQISYSESFYNNGHFSLGFVYLFAISVLLFGVIFVVTYSYIVWKVVLQRNEFDKRSKGRTGLRKIARQKNLVLYCVFVVLTYMVCTYPLAISTIVTSGSQTLSKRCILLIVNSTLDPFVYFVKGYLDQRSLKSKSPKDTAKTIKD